MVGRGVGELRGRDRHLERHPGHFPHRGELHLVAPDVQCGGLRAVEVDASGTLSGSLTLQGSQTGTLPFTGTVVGKTITMHFSGTTQEGSNSCTATGDLTATRP